TAVAALAVVVSACAATPAPHRPTASVVDEVAGRALEGGDVVGLAVVVARDGAVVLERGYGHANLQAHESMTRDAILDYFSIGKHTTAAILLRLAERGDLDLDAPAR